MQEAERVGGNMGSAQSQVRQVRQVRQEGQLGTPRSIHSIFQAQVVAMGVPPDSQSRRKAAAGQMHPADQVRKPLRKVMVGHMVEIRPSQAWA